MIKILMIEDDEDMCEEIREILEAANYHVTTAFDGNEGLSLFKEDRFDLILLDLKLPGMDGLALLKFIKKTRPEMKVLILTGSPKGEIDVTSLKIADGVFNKPCDVDVLLGKIRELCELRGKTGNRNYCRPKA